MRLEKMRRMLWFNDVVGLSAAPNPALVLIEAQAVLRRCQKRSWPEWIRFEGGTSHGSEPPENHAGGHPGWKPGRGPS